jgi:hypothetical protein
MVALMFVWSGCFAALLITLAVIVTRPSWLRPVLLAAAVAEMAWGGFMFSTLRRSSKPVSRPRTIR